MNTTAIYRRIQLTVATALFVALAALVAPAVAQPQTLSTGTGQGFPSRPMEIVVHTSPGGSGQLLVWLIERETGAKFKTVSFKGGSEAIMQVMGGHTHFTTENISEAVSAVETKKLRVLAVSSGQRLSVVPDVPTLKELGYNIHMGTGRGFAMAAWRAERSRRALRSAT